MDASIQQGDKYSKPELFGHIASMRRQYSLLLCLFAELLNIILHLRQPLCKVCQPSNSALRYRIPLMPVLPEVKHSCNSASLLLASQWGFQSNLR